jgi:porin
MQENPHQEGGRPPAVRSHRESGAGLPGTVKLGAWVHTSRFADQRFNVQGGLLAGSSIAALQHRGNFGVYAMLDQMLWRIGASDSDRGLNFFLRASTAPSDRNPVDLYVDTGFTFKGPFLSRPEDTIGLGLAYGRMSPAAGARDQDLVAVTGVPMPIRDYEAALELTYQLQITEDWSLQPDLQYIVHPGGHVSSPAAPSGAAIPNATVLGMRMIRKF